MGKLKEGTGCLLVGIAYPTMYLLGLFIHVLTIVVAFARSGVDAAITTLLFPIFAQIFWFFKVWSVAGTVFNRYCLMILTYVGCWIIALIGMNILAPSKEQE